MSDGRKYYCFCSSNCRFETMTKEQILAAIAQAAETGLVYDVDAGFITKVKEQNAGGNLTFWLGTQAQYNALASYDANCFYILSDSPSFASFASTLKSHLDNKQNPHGVTAEQVGAAPASHATDKNNPHGVTAEQVGATPASHAEDMQNPHGVTAEQVGADPAGTAASIAGTVQSNLTTHMNNKQNPHGVTAAQLGLKTENWTFTLEDGSTVTKAVYVG